MENFPSKESLTNSYFYFLMVVIIVIVIFLKSRIVIWLSSTGCIVRECEFNHELTWSKIKPVSNRRLKQSLTDNRYWETPRSISLSPGDLTSQSLAQIPWGKRNEQYNFSSLYQTEIVFFSPKGEPLSLLRLLIFL